MARTTKHIIQAEIETVIDADNVAYPLISIEYSFLPGSPAVMYQRNGDPGWPADPDEIEMLSAVLIDRDGLMTLTNDRVNEMAEAWLYANQDRAIDMATEERRERA